MRFFCRSSVIGIGTFLVLSAVGGAAWATVPEAPYAWPWKTFVFLILMILLIGTVGLSWVRKYKKSGLRFFGTRPMGKSNDEISLGARQGLSPGLNLQSISWKGRDYLLAVHRDRVVVIDTINPLGEKLNEAPSNEPG